MGTYLQIRVLLKETWPEYIVPQEFADTPMKVNLTDFLVDRHVREGRGANPAIKFMDKVISYAQLQQTGYKFGNGLKAVGVEAQDAAAALRDLGEQVAEAAEDRHQHLVAGRDQRHENGLDAGARGAVDHQRPLVRGAEDRARSAPWCRSCRR